MIIINNKKYNDYDIKVLWEGFTVFSRGKKRQRISPFITFNVENNKFIGLEFTFSDEMFKQTKENIKTNIKEYISDILYKDEKGWTSLIDLEYDCDIIRFDEKEFRIIFSINSAFLVLIQQRIF